MTDPCRPLGIGEQLDGENDSDDEEEDDEDDVLLMFDETVAFSVNGAPFVGYMGELGIELLLPLEVEAYGTYIGGATDGGRLK